MTGEPRCFLFEEEYSVPLLSPEFAAFLATFGELVFPVLLVIGLFSLVSSLGLFVINIVAVISLEAIAPAAELYHVVWGLILMGLAMCGPGPVLARQVDQSPFERFLITNASPLGVFGFHPRIDIVRRIRPF